MHDAYRADRAKHLNRDAGHSAYCMFSVALVALGCACLIAAAVTGAAWLLAVAVGVAILAAALATCS